MDMQDKELDQLFRSKLKDFEIEPSKEVWPGVNESLGYNWRKKLIPVLSIAASIILFIVSGVLFIPKNDNAVKQSGKSHLAVIKQHAAVAPNTAIITANNLVHLYHAIKINTRLTMVKQHVTTNNHSVIPAKNYREVLTAASSRTKTRQAFAGDSSTILAVIKPTVRIPITDAIVTGKQLNALPPAQKIADTAPVKKHGIHGLGDVLNIVIAAVDKRKDKIIEFADSDGDGATVTAVNLGPIKVKKEN